MRATGAIAMRELSSLFRVPVGWIVVALWLFLWALLFFQLCLIPGQPATLRPLFAISSWLLLPVAPAISMRLFSEELRSGAIEPLMTAPVSEASLAIGKFAGAVIFLALMLAPTLVFVGVLWIYADPPPDPGPILAGYLSLLLLGALFIAVGMLASSLTSSQTLAFLGALLFMLLWMLVTTQGERWAPERLRPVLASLSLEARLGDFAKGVIDTGHLVFFGAVSALFICATTAALAARRWR
ncbi:MAG: ABC transporter permease [Phycisphaerales bacterium JB039]